jgi:hypothetical protein
MTAPHHQQVTCTHDCQFFLVANVLCIAVWSDSQAAVSAGKSAGADSQSAEGNRPPAHPQRFHRPHPASHRCPLPLHPIYPLTFDRSPAICHRIPDWDFGPRTGLRGRPQTRGGAAGSRAGRRGRWGLWGGWGWHITHRGGDGVATTGKPSFPPQI